MALNWTEIRRNLQLLNVTAESESPLVRWSVAAIVLILFWFWLVEPVHGWRQELRDKAARDAQQAVRLKALRESAAEWAAAYSEAEAAAEAVKPLYFQQSSDTAAQAVIQQLLSRQARNRGVQVESSKLMQAEPQAGVGNRLGIAMKLTGDLVDILQLLDDVSRANHIVMVDRWQMRRDRRGNISAQVTLSGFRAIEVDENADG